MKTKMRRRLAAVIAVLLTAIILFGSTVSAYADVNGFRLYRGTFHYTGNEDTFYYSDGYFSTSGTEANDHLRTMSAAMAFSVLGTSPQDTVDLLTDIGMETDSIVMEDMVWGTPDTIGTVIAKKELKDIPLVAVAIRGSDYAGEWANNVLAGSSGDASGFACAAEKVCARIKAYLERFGISKAKIWVCGYSRAGGVANLVGKAMNETPGTFHTAEDDIFVYTFEAPRCSADDTVYKNIRNVFDVNDLVPHFYPESWGLHLNGIQEKIGDPSDTMMAKCFHVATEGYIKEIEERPKSEFLDQFEEFVGTTVSREAYAASTEQYLSNVCTVCLGKSWEERQELLDYLARIGELVQESPELNSVVFALLINTLDESNINYVCNMISGFMDEARETENPPLTDEEYATLKEALKPLITFMLTLADVDLDYKEVNARGKTTYYNLYHLVTLFANIKEFILPHMNTNVFDKLKQEDAYYTAGVRIWPGNVIVGDKCHTFADNGWPLQDIVESVGCFTEDDIAVWSNGYDLRVDTVITEMEVETGSDLWFEAAGKVDKSMNIGRFYDVTMNKTVGYRTSPAGKVKIKENDQFILIPAEFAKKCYRLAVVQVSDYGSKKIESKIITTENGDVELHFNADIPAIYASAYDDHRWYTSADIDRDQDVTVLDTTHFQRYLANMEEFDDYQLLAADVDGDGEPTVIDISWIQRSLVSMAVPYPVGEDIERKSLG